MAQKSDQQMSNERAKVEPQPCKFFIDTEFIESGPSFPLILLSIGIVADDGREFYVANADAPLELANDWVKTNVIPHLGKPQISIKDLPAKVRAFIGDCKPQFWGYYADYDWVVFCQLFGTMMDLPKGWPMYCRDIKQFCDSLGNPKLPAQSSTEHNALNDARWNKIAYEFLEAGAAAVLPTPTEPITLLKDGILAMTGRARIAWADRVREFLSRAVSSQETPRPIGENVECFICHRLQEKK